MSWSWKFGAFAGIETHVHTSFVLLLGWAAWAGYGGSGTWASAILGVVFVLAVFASVLLHEFGHALVARRYGIETRRIVLLPIGGVAQLEGDPESPKAEIAIAAAGPLVNFALAGLLAVIAVAIPALRDHGLLMAIVVANVSLGLFNLVPAFPLDGGRVLRALLALRLEPGRATRAAVGIAKLSAIGFVIAAIVTEFFVLAVVGIVVFVAAHLEDQRCREFGEIYAPRSRPEPAPT